MSDRYEIRLSGSGGQGIILGGVILAEAASIYDEKHAAQTQAYGPASRGGASKAEVIISESEIDYPKAMNIDLLLALTAEACEKYHKEIRSGGILLVDSEAVGELPEGDFRAYSVPIFKLAVDEVGKSIVGNIIALGLITQISGVVSKEAVEKAVLDRVPKGTEDINRKALKIGYREGKKLDI